MSRPRLKRHYLAKERVPWRWGKEPGRTFLTTVCGIQLYDRYTIEQVVEQRSKAQLLDEIWVQEEPPPSKVEGIDIYYQIKWHKRELAVVTAGATCIPCSKKGPA